MAESAVCAGGDTLMLAPTNAEVVESWREMIVSRTEEIDPEDEDCGMHWHSIWVGFVVGIGRPDLATWKDYDRLGYPEER